MSIKHRNSINEMPNGSLIVILWAIYFFAAFTLGNRSIYTQPIIWIGGMVVGIATVIVFIRNKLHPQNIPRECYILGLFWFWSLIGGFFAEDMDMFMNNLKLVFELVVLSFTLAVVLKYSGKGGVILGAFLGIAAWRMLMGGQTHAGDFVGMEQLLRQDEILMQRTLDANATGFISAVGILGLLALLGETKARWLRVALIAGGILSLAGVVMSASRGALVTLMAIAILWPTMCLSGSKKSKGQGVAISIFFITVSYFLFEFIIKETYLGTRFTSAVNMEDTSTMSRIEFIVIGFQLLLDNPLFGCGLGQFGLASGTGFYAHNDFAEVAAATGIFGTFLYYSVYIMSWRKLTKSLQYVRTPLFRYRINIARVLLLLLLISGFIFRPNFILQDSMFLIAVVIGMASWSERQARLALEQVKMNRREVNLLLSKQDCALRNSGEWTEINYSPLAPIFDTTALPGKLI